MENIVIIDQMSPAIKNASGIPTSSRNIASQTKHRAYTPPDIIMTLPMVTSLLMIKELNIVDTIATTINIPHPQRNRFLQLSLSPFSIITFLTFVPS
jgi:hypothetical protein